jgi:spore germination protein GerM
VPHQAIIYTVDLARGTDANNYLVPQTIPLSDARDPAREAIQALLAVPHSPLPRGTKLRSIKIANGMATVDFSRPPVDETRGEEAQAQALEALQYTLGQFPNVSSFQITVRGRALPAIGEAAGGPMDVIRPGDSPPESGGA